MVTRVNRQGEPDLSERPRFGGRRGVPRRAIAGTERPAIPKSITKAFIPLNRPVAANLTSSRSDHEVASRPAPGPAVNTTEDNSHKIYSYE